MRKSFADRETKAIFEGGDADPKDAERARKRLPTQLCEKPLAKLDEIDAAEDPKHLDLPSNQLKKLSGDRKGQYAIRINRPYRICFTWRGGDAHDVEVVDYHGGSRHLRRGSGLQGVESEAGESQVLQGPIATVAATGEGLPNVAPPRKSLILPYPPPTGSGLRAQ